MPDDKKQQTNDDPATKPPQVPKTHPVKATLRHYVDGVEKTAEVMIDIPLEVFLATKLSGR